jgi:hypothetical protein
METPTGEEAHMRKPYVAPTFHVIGAVQALTQGAVYTDTVSY